MRAEFDITYKLDCSEVESILDQLDVDDIIEYLGDDVVMDCLCDKYTENFKQYAIKWLDLVDIDEAEEEKQR